MESVYELSELGPALKENTIVKEISVDEELSEEILEKLIACRSRSVSNAKNLIIEAAIDTIESTVDFDSKDKLNESFSNSIDIPVIMNALTLPSNAINQHDSYTEIVVPVIPSIDIDSSEFLGLAEEDEIGESRSRSASVAPAIDYKTTINLEELMNDNTEYYIYISSNFTSSMSTYLINDLKRIWICGEMPAEMPSNFVYVLPPSTDDCSHEEKWRYRTAAPHIDLFCDRILKNRYCLQLFNVLQKKQKQIWLKGYCTGKDFDNIIQMDKFKSFGLPYDTSNYLNNKVQQFLLLRDHVPLPKHKILRSNEIDCLEEYESIASEGGVFIALEYGIAGSGTFHVISYEDFEAFISVLEASVDIIICEWLTLDLSISVDLIIANPDEIIVYGIIEQVFDSSRGLKCMGSNYPALIDENNANIVKNIALQCGKVLANMGTTGYVSLDISRDGPTQTWYFTEINARYPGSVSERLTMMEVTRPTNYANIMNLELYAIRDKTFHGHTLWKEPSNLYWSRRRILADADFELSEKAVKNIAAILYEKCNLILHTDVNSAVPLFKSIYDQECNNNTENEGITTINHTQHAFTNIDDVTNTTTTTTNTNSNNNNKPRVPQAAAGLYGFLEGGISCKQDATLGKLVVAASNYEDREFVLDVLEKAIHLVIPCISYG